MKQEKASIKIKAAGPEKDITVCENWVKMWNAVGIDNSGISSDYEKQTLDFISRGREVLNYQTFIAEDDKGNVIGSASCQVWGGPQPTQFLTGRNENENRRNKIGTVWAVYVDPNYRRCGIATRLMEHCIEHWRNIGCNEAVLLYASEDGKRVYQRLGFGPGRMLAYDFTSKNDDTQTFLQEIQEEKKENADNDDTTDKITFVEAIGSNHDLLLAANFQRNRVKSDNNDDTKMSLFELSSNNNNCVSAIDSILSFIKDARKRLGFRAFIAFKNGVPIGSVCCQVWDGPLPLILKESTLKFGSMWGFYIHPDHKCDHVGLTLVGHCIQHLKSLGCHKILTLCPDPETEVFLKTKCAFQASNAMALSISSNDESTDLNNGQIQDGANKPVIPTNVASQMRTLSSTLRQMTDQQLLLLLHSNYNQLSAMQNLDGPTKDIIIDLQKEMGRFVDPSNNWFTTNVKKLGKGFDLQKLSKDPKDLASKFDRLANVYDEWTLGNHSQVESWIARMANKRVHKKYYCNSEQEVILDLCCGTGLMGHMLRLCGYSGLLFGFDISAQMIHQVKSRPICCYDYASTANTNNGFESCLTKGIADVIICTGAMELLQTSKVLNEFSRLLKPSGELWVSFQAEPKDNQTSSTAHQNVHGISETSMRQELINAGFEIIQLERCDNAFYTPSPKLDGTLLPVPYFFVQCNKINN